MNTKKWPRKGAKSTARPAATKTVPGERLAQSRRGAEKDQEETPCLVFSAPLRLCAKKSLRECVILTDCSAEVLFFAPFAPFCGYSFGPACGLCYGLLSIPSSGAPTPLAGALQIPELAFYKSVRQNSIAKLALLTYSTKTREHVFSSGPVVGKSYNKYYAFLGMIRWTTTDIPEKKKK